MKQFIFAFAILIAGLEVSVAASAVPDTAEHQKVVIPELSAWRTADSAHFTGHAKFRMMFEQKTPAAAYGGLVSFEAGARTNWHVHPLGQTLIVTSGTGYTQSRLKDGTLGPLKIIRVGDVVICPPGVSHWHGASPYEPMTHLAIGEHSPEAGVEWQEAVDEKVYLQNPN